MLICKQSPRILTDLSEPMLQPFVLSLPFNVSDKKWTSLILKLKKSMLKYLKPCVLLSNISNLLWALLILLHWDKLTLRFQMLNGRISEVLNKLKNNFNKWFFSQSSTHKNSWNLVCNHRKVFFSMVLQDVVKHFWPRQLQVNAAPTSFQLKAHNFWQCILVRVRPM